MKKTFLKGALAALVGVGLMAGSAMAASYEFVDMIDTWGGFESALITENSPLSYIHDLTDDVDFGAGDLVTSATLELDFTNDYYDGAIQIPTSWISGYWSDQTEHIYYSFNGSGWSYLDEVDNGQYSVTIDLGLINIDHQLGVSLAVTNWDDGGTLAWLDSRLYGSAETAPVPEPATMLLFGTGLAGLAAVRRRKK